MAGCFWDRTAGVYDLTQRISPAAEAAVRRAAGLIPAGASVLDCAAGTGAFSLAAAERAGLVLCTDLSQPMLDRAAAKAQRQGARNIRFARTARAGRRLAGGHCRQCAPPASGAGASGGGAVAGDSPRGPAASAYLFTGGGLPPLPGDTRPLAAAGLPALPPVYEGELCRLSLQLRPQRPGGAYSRMPACRVCSCE